MGRYHDGGALELHVFFEFSEVVHRLSLQAVVLFSPHFALLQQLLVDGDAGAAVAGAQVL
jgi:hypothetical protein